MYRAMGIPARYVTGYAIPREEFDDNNQAYALDSMGHAWTEIYLNGVGWMPVDMTAPSPDNPLYQHHSESQENSRSENSRFENSRSESSRPDSVSAESSGETSQTQHWPGLIHTGDGPAGRPLNWGAFFIILGSLSLPILTAVFLRMRRKTKLFLRSHPQDRADYKDAIRTLGAQMFQALAFSGYRPAPDVNDQQYWKQVPVDETMRVLLERAAYGGCPMSAQEYMQALAKYQELIGLLSSRWNLPQKFWARYIRCWQ